MFSLKGKTVVVTGGGRGIGRGIARAMAQAGADVLITGRSPEPLEETATELRAMGATVGIVATDIMSFDGIAVVVGAAIALGGNGYIDCWVNNAGSASAGDVGPLMDMDERQWDAVVDLNLKWTFFAAQAAARVMTRGGSIVNISSRSASQPCPMTGNYGAAKAGVENLTATMAVEWGHLGIRINAIAPGVVLTESSSAMTSESRRRRQIETVPLRRLGVVDDVGPLAVYFASDESSWTSGTVVQVTGGSRIPVGVLTYLHRMNRDAEARESADG
ncbi:SDR family oxidoreductase (plasmid) [Sphingomonas paeninsulae]|jgi:NAD(P)-dependent dehydrogenase (short-subunit alcohol dehydrogenase family)|uniref:SDR family oxidoreductase n=1 Tax=Sphingomonas paeninsulae TaxID=2319844 RepID=A0A494TGV1_SPHPE|nr:SDR family oxidoreductase [Sphingomonas paeninsulae]AYJ85076.1 SDR family oxidoreductase [Sphingomonas paeninsulae]